MKNILLLLSFVVLSDTTHAQWTYRYLTDGQHEVSISQMLNKDTGITITRFAPDFEKFHTVITYDGFNSFHRILSLDTTLDLTPTLTKTSNSGFILSTVDSLYFTNNCGNSFISKPNTVINSFDYKWSSGKLFIQDVNNSGSSNKLLSSADSGQTWITINDTADKYFMLSDQTIWITRDIEEGFNDYKTELWRTTNGGTNWQLMHTSPKKMYDRNNLFFISDNIGYWTKETYDSLFKTTDGGANWNFISVQPINIVSYIYFINEQVGFIGHNSIYKTADGGKTWIGQKSGGGVISNLHCIDSLQCFAYTQSPGAIYYTANQGGGPFTSVQESNIVPSPLVLFPNPANNSVTIQLSTITTQTSIDIYDIMGKLVLHKNTITQITELDISTLKTGMYMVTINGDGVKESKKLLVE